VKCWDHIEKQYSERLLIGLSIPDFPVEPLNNPQSAAKAPFNLDDGTIIGTMVQADTPVTARPSTKLCSIIQTTN
jgi:hypothetical protein